MAKAMRVAAVVAAYFCVFFASTLLTMTILIKGEEIITPDFIGKSIQDSRQIALKKSLHLKEVTGDYGPAYPPHQVINQFPSFGTRIKENSAIKVFVNSEIAQVEVPDIRGVPIKEGEKLLQEKKLNRGHVSYISVKDVPPDTIISQSISPHLRVNENREIDILISRGVENISFIMPDLIGRAADQVLVFFESRGLKISSIEYKPYFGLKPGIILKQSPDPGFEINSWNKIGIQVSK